MSTLMLQFHLALVISLISIFTYGQTNTFPQSGNVGIGTLSPIGYLTVNDGNGINVLAYFGAYHTVNAKGLYFSRPVINTNPVNIQGTESGVGAADISLQVEGGNVGIGTSNTHGNKLAVNGSIHAKEVKVDLAGFPDYVFMPDYHLLK